MEFIFAILFIGGFIVGTLWYVFRDIDKAYKENEALKKQVEDLSFRPAVKRQ